MTAGHVSGAELAGHCFDIKSIPFLNKVRSSMGFFLMREMQETGEKEVFYQQVKLFFKSLNVGLSSNSSFE